MCSTNPKLSGSLLSQLDQSHFHGEECLEAYNSITSFVENKGRPPTFEYLCESRDLPVNTRQMLAEADAAPRNPAQLAELVSRLGTLRSTRIFYSLCTEGMSMLQRDKIDITSILSMSQDRLAAMQVSKSLKDCLTHIGKDGNADDIVKEILYGEDQDQFIPTGWNTFDERNGGLPRGGLTIIGGSSGAGKSHMVTQLSRTQASRGYKVVIVPLEMSRNESLVRYLANVSGADSLRINLKKLTEDEKASIYRRYRKFQRQIEAAGGRLTIYVPQSDVTIQEVFAAVHSYGADAIYIDYIGLLAGADGDDQWKQLGRIARQGKVYAGNHNKAVVLAAQVGEDGRLRYSQTVKEHATLAFSFVATQESHEKGYVDMDMLKGRNQQQFRFTLKIDKATSTVRDLEPAEAAAIAQSKAPQATVGGKRVKKAPGANIPELEVA
jgi:archaellum biogenesis ATPase FlaH